MNQTLVQKILRLVKDKWVADTQNQFYCLNLNHLISFQNIPFTAHVNTLFLQEARLVLTCLTFNIDLQDNAIATQNIVSSLNFERDVK